jgi:hypothetical protein
MKSAIRIRKTIFVLFPAFLLFSCNLPAAKPAQFSITGTAGIEATGTPKTNIGATVAAKPCTESADGSLRLCFLELADGETVSTNPGEPIRISAEASGLAVIGISLSAEPGGFAKFEENAGNADPFRAEFAWLPELGSGTYSLKLETMTADKSETATIVISITVTGLPAISPTPSLEPGGVYPEIRSQILSTFLKTFDINLVAPAIARKFRSGVEDPWVSTAYIGNDLYEVDVYPDGRVEAWTSPIFPNTILDYKTSLFKEPLCRPAGVYSMLVVFLDYGNIPVGRDEVLADLAAATTATNTDYAAFPSAGPGSAPILQIRTTGVVIPVPNEVAGKRITPDQIRHYAGVDPSAFNWIAQVDLDANSTLRLAGGDMLHTSFGYAYTGCPATQTQGNIQITIDAKDQLTGDYGRLADTMLAHEVFHLFGYPGSHIWPCIRGPQKDAADDCAHNTIPALMLGWVDVDGDGIPEILDPTPYGMNLA